MTTGRCDKCVYYFAIERPIESSDKTPKGLCRRYPPAILAENFTYEDGLHYGCWPAVFDDNWCGEFA